MEFERAIYRVYERCMEGVRDDVPEHGSTNSKSCKFLEFLALGFAISMFVILVWLHIAFVGSPGCLANYITTDALVNGSSLVELRDDQLLYINIGSANPPTAQYDEYDEYDTAIATDDYLKAQLPVPRMVATSASRSTNLRTRTYATMKDHFNFIDSSAPAEVSEDKSTANASNSNNTLSGETGRNITSPGHRVYTIPGYDYIFSFNAGILLLSDDVLHDHSFKTLNITLSGSECFGSAGTQSLIPLGGMDTVVLNFIMHTVQESGHIVTADGQYFKWGNHDYHRFESFEELLTFKLGILFSSLMSFFLLSAVTAMLVRALISSGVVLMFPIFGMFRLCGVQGINFRLISISYPWIGIPLEIIRMRNQPVTPFILAHISRVLLYYFLYQATQMFFTFWFYNQYLPGQQELWLFAVMMLWEYYSMIYVRSAESIALFPRASLALFLLYHIYYYSFPSGFHVLALVVMFFALVFLMVHCIRVYELKAFQMGSISLQQPRMLYNSLPWPVWRADLAPEYTLYMPVNARSVGAYQAAVPNRPGTAPAAPAAAAPAATAAATPAAPAVPTGDVNSAGESRSAVGGGRSGGQVEMRAVGTGIGSRIDSEFAGARAPWMGSSSSSSSSGSGSGSGSGYAELNVDSSHGMLEAAEDTELGIGGNRATANASISDAASSRGDGRGSVSGLFRLSQQQLSSSLRSRIAGAVPAGGGGMESHGTDPVADGRAAADLDEVNNPLVGGRNTDTKGSGNRGVGFQ